MDQRVYEFYKAILIGSRVQRIVEGITELGRSSDISTEISDGVLRAELFVAEKSPTTCAYFHGYVKRYFQNSLFKSIFLGGRVQDGE